VEIDELEIAAYNNSQYRYAGITGNWKVSQTVYFGCLIMIFKLAPFRQDLRKNCFRRQVVCLSQADVKNIFKGEAFR